MESPHTSGHVVRFLEHDNEFQWPAVPSCHLCSHPVCSNCAMQSFQHETTFMQSTSSMLENPHPAEFMLQRINHMTCVGGLEVSYGNVNGFPTQFYESCVNLHGLVENTHIQITFCQEVCLGVGVSYSRCIL